MATEIWVNIGSGNGLLPDNTKPLPEPMLTDHQWSPVTFILGQFHKRCLNHQSLKPRSHCADHSLPMFPIIANRPDLSWSSQNHQIVALTPDLCLSKTASTNLVRQLYDGSVWFTLSTFFTTISTTTYTIDTTALTMLTTTPTLLLICYHD